MAAKKKVKRRKKKTVTEAFAESLISPDKWKWKVMFGVPSMGIIRMEWHNAFVNMVLPMNWSVSRIVHPVRVLTPLRYHVAEAQNVIVQRILAQPQWEYLLFVEDDVIVPPNLMTRMQQWIKHDVYPMVSGLYNLKATPTQPMTFRGRGSGSYEGWRKGPGRAEKQSPLPHGVKPSEVAMCDGVPTGCLLISTKLLRVAWNHSAEMVLRCQRTDGSISEIQTREVFQTIREAGIDPENGNYFARYATSDLHFCDNAIDKKWLKEAGYPEAAKMKYPFPVDLAIQCGHITQDGTLF